MHLRDILPILDDLAPLAQAEAWDNVGLLVGDPQQDVQRILLTIDYTSAVAEEARQLGCDLVVSYHPPIFQAIKRMTVAPLIVDAVRRGTAIYSPHTALDVADGGTNDMLADAVGMSASDRAPLRLIQPKATQYKLVTFVPEAQIDHVAAALFGAGAGQIGDYSQCSFRSSGTGTFFGAEGTSPAVGSAGHFQQVPEIRLETVIPIAQLMPVLDALRKSHPYEEPAFDLVQLAAAPQKLGQGRIGAIERASRASVIERIKRALSLEHVLVAGPVDAPTAKVACCAGSCGDLLEDALAQRADLYLTGEMRHHDALRAAAAGMTVVCTLHSNSERAVLARVRDRLQPLLSDLPVLLSKSDRDPFAIV